MTDAHKIAANVAWLAGVKPLMRAIRDKYRAYASSPESNTRLTWGTSVTPGFNFVVNPGLEVVDLYYQLVAFHTSLYPGQKIYVEGGTNIVAIPGMNINKIPAAAAPGTQWPDLPDPYQLPVNCIPCIVPPQTARSITCT